MGFIDFTNGEVLTADQMDLVMRQGVMRFADAAARDTALSAVLAEGMMAYLDDTDEVLKYDGSQWIDISGDITGVTAGTALTGGGTSGNVTLDVDESALTIAQSQVTDLVSDIASKQDDVITTQGDLVIGDASGDPVRLPVGAADQVLTSDGTTVSFQDAGGGGAELLSTTALSGFSTTVSNINQNFRKLVVYVKGIELNEFTVPIYRPLNSSGAPIFLNFIENIANNGNVSTNQIDENEIETGIGLAPFSGNDQTIVFIFDNYSESSHSPFYSYGGFKDNANAQIAVSLFGKIKDEVSGFEVSCRFSGESFTAGTIEIYGVK